MQNDSTLFQVQRLNHSAVTTRTMVVIINNTYTNTPRLNQKKTRADSNPCGKIQPSKSNALTTRPLQLGPF